MSEQNADAPEQVRKFAPKRNPRSNRHPTDQAGEALIGMLHEAARASDENTSRVMEFVHELEPVARALRSAPELAAARHCRGCSTEQMDASRRRSRQP